MPVDHWLTTDRTLPLCKTSNCSDGSIFIRMNLRRADTSINSDFWKFLANESIYACQLLKGL